MGKLLRLAVAGSGKTTSVIDNLNLDKNFLVLTYTENNYQNLRCKIFQRFGFLPENIKVFTYFSFLYSFCFQPFLKMQLHVNGITFERCNNYYAKGNARYIDRNDRVFSNRLAKLIKEKNAIGHVADRLQKYFDMIIIDEIQDFAGHDFNFLPTLVSSTNHVLFVGDFYQHTFDTSSDGAVNKNLHSDLNSYIARFEKMGLTIDQQTLDSSYRCSPSVCKFITDRIGIGISSHRDDSTTIELLDSDSEIKSLLHNDNIIKLFYRKHHNYPYYSNNWGNSKGLDHYFDVGVVLNNSTFKHFSNNTLSVLKPQTKNKLYVAITRAKGRVFFIEEKALKEILS